MTGGQGENKKKNRVVSKPEAKEYTLEFSVGREDRDIEKEEGQTDILNAIKEFIKMKKFDTMVNDIEEIVRPSATTEDVFECLLDLQVTQYGRKKVVVGFIKGKSELELKEIFEGVKLGDVMVAVRFDHTTKLLMPIGYLERTQAKFSRK